VQNQCMHSSIHPSIRPSTPPSTGAHMMFDAISYTASFSMNGCMVALQLGLDALAATAFKSGVARGVGVVVGGQVKER